MFLGNFPTLRLPIIFSVLVHGVSCRRGSPPFHSHFIAFGLWSILSRRLGNIICHFYEARLSRMEFLRGFFAAVCPLFLFNRTHAVSFLVILRVFLFSPCCIMVRFFLFLVLIYFFCLGAFPRCVAILGCPFGHENEALKNYENNLSKGRERRW